tara:strand:- start:97 stop:333 length:237 start_codon:yes stop_codon:yes gene_type:complete
MSKEEHKNRNNKICSYHTTNIVNINKTKKIDIESSLFGKGTTLNKDQISQFPKNNIKFNNVSFSTSNIWYNQTRIQPE